MDVVGAVDRFQRKHKVLGFPLAVAYKFYDDQGVYLAALITYYAFIAIFPLLLLATSVLGFVLEGNPQLQQNVLDTSLNQFPVLGDQLRAPDALTGSIPAVLIGAVGALYAALGIGQAGQNAMNNAWGVPRNRRPNLIMSRVRSLHLLGLAGLAILLTTGLTIVERNRDFFGLDLGTWAERGLAASQMVINILMFMMLFRLGPNITLRRREVAPGAVLAGLSWHYLLQVGTDVVASVVSTASSVNQVFAVVLGLVVWIFVSAVLVVLCIEVNVVRVRQLYPRALMTLFTDSVDLTEADRRAYRSLIELNRLKDTADITVDWTWQDDEPTQVLPAADLARYRSRRRRGSSA